LSYIAILALFRVLVGIHIIHVRLEKKMKILMGIIILLCGIYSAYSAIKSLTAGKTEDLEDEFPPIKKRKNPIKFYLYTLPCMAGGIAMIIFSIIMLWVQIVN
jgi:hypothetical protein